MFKQATVKTSEYSAWCEMRYRCSNRNHSAYPNYGGRGIQVCQRWQLSFQNFLDDLGPKPTNAHTLERCNNNGNYSPENCKWATRKEQSFNRRTNVAITAFGKTQFQSVWAIEYKIRQDAISYRLKIGLNPEAAILESVKAKNRLHKRNHTSNLSGSLTAAASFK